MNKDIVIVVFFNCTVHYRTYEQQLNAQYKHTSEAECHSKAEASHVVFLNTAAAVEDYTIKVMLL